jgi:hypothetical protein
MADRKLFVAVFTLGTVTAGFGFAIYTFLLTTDSGFIGIAKRSIYYRHMLIYVLRRNLFEYRYGGSVDSRHAGQVCPRSWFLSRFLCCGLVWR